MTRLLIAASGTGGHVLPALAVAETLPANWELHWLGVPNRLERQLVPDEIPLHTVKAGGLQGGILPKLANLLRLTVATWGVVRLIRREGIEMIFSTGGYIAAPAILAGRYCGIPVVLHESNSVPGRVTRLLGGLCDQVAIGLEQASERLPRCSVRFTGTPVRRDFFSPSALPSWVPEDTGPLLLVMGGSQGAVGLNRMIRPLVSKLLDSGCRIVHLCGNNDPDSGSINRRGYVELAFSDEIPGLMQHADLVISRAGAGSISEILACGCASILVPLPGAADNHQEANASEVAAKGAALMVLEHGADDPELEEKIWLLLGPKLKRSMPLGPLKTIQLAAKKLGQKEASAEVARLLCMYAKVKN